ncbi:hypothetical protein [Anaerophilus nitritogenes]|uniref:hypothetical protein n=1 Tax=Anaerophilus nitritogenes TaxID=2498136 RepID=UPI0013EA37B1|nr:hypothetical protein [Anaerophilus nitritogenes]
MELICKVCGNHIKDVSASRCPRCYTLLKELPKCENCKGCSLTKMNCSKKA